MKTSIKQILFISITFLSFSLINTTESPEEYSTIYTNIIHIGSDSTELPLVVNTLSSKTRLFTNSNKKLAKKIQAERKSNILMDKAEISGVSIKSFPFSLTKDTTNLNNKNINGEIGLGINDQKSSELIDALISNQVITKKYIEIEEFDTSSKTLTINISPDKPKDYSFCKLSDKEDLDIDEDDFYHESWICELSHILIGDTEEDLIWNNTAKVNAHVVFDTRGKYVYLPEEYLDHVSKYLDFKKNGCKLEEDENTDDKYFSCPVELKDNIDDINDLYFLIEGKGYKLSAEDFFEENNGRLESLIRFFDSDDNIWVLGIPFLKNYKIIFDYENLQVGLNGEDIINFKEEYKKWTMEEEIEEEKGNEGILEEINTSDSKVLLTIGIIAGLLIIIAVIFLFVRSLKRANPKYHIELNEAYNKNEFYQ